MIGKKIFFYKIFLILIILLSSMVFSSCAKEKTPITTAAEHKSTETTVNEHKSTETTVAEHKSTETTTIEHESTESQTTSIKGSFIVGSNPLYQGLHTTGTPIEVDIKTYRLYISGAVDKEQSDMNPTSWTRT